MNRRSFFRQSLIASSAAAATATLAGSQLNLLTAVASAPAPSALEGRSFTFARLRYASGNWDADPKMPANLLDSLARYTRLAVNPVERIVDAASDELFESPFLYLTGNRHVRFAEEERARLRRYLREHRGFLFVDDCEHDAAGPFALSFEREIGLILDRPAERLRRLPEDHALYRAFFVFPAGPPATAHELNGWGDRQTHDYLRGAWVGDRLAVLYSNKDYGCEWNYDPTNKRFLAADNTRFGVNIVTYALQSRQQSAFTFQPVDRAPASIE